MIIAGGTQHYYFHKKYYNHNNYYLHHHHHQPPPPLQLTWTLPDISSVSTQTFHSSFKIVRVPLSLRVHGNTVIQHADINLIISEAYLVKLNTFG